MNCDLNVYSHISYKPLQDCDYRPPNKTTQKEKQSSYKTILFMLEWRCANCLNVLHGLF